MTRLISRFATATLLLLALTVTLPVAATPSFAAGPTTPADAMLADAMTGTAGAIAGPTGSQPVCGICPVPGDTICWETVPVDCPIPVVLTHVAPKDILVHWHTVAGTARPGIDYVDVKDAVAIVPAGKTTGYAQVEIIPNSTLGGTRWFVVEFSSPPDAQLVRTQVTVTITPTNTPSAPASP
jgi:hypothetical protein